MKTVKLKLINNNYFWRKFIEEKGILEKIDIKSLLYKILWFSTIILTMVCLVFSTPSDPKYLCKITCI
jgi:hypothetical protein